MLLSPTPAPLQYSCLENPRDRGPCWAAIYGVAQSRTRLTRVSSSSSNEKAGVEEYERQAYREQIKQHLGTPPRIQEPVSFRWWNVLHSMCTDFSAWFSESGLIYLISKVFHVGRVIHSYNEILFFSGVLPQLKYNVQEIECKYSVQPYKKVKYSFPLISLRLAPPRRLCPGSPQRSQLHLQCRIVSTISSSGTVLLCRLD